ncbi:vitamin K epoxide reductase family protein [filamentous cyanobacterium LEGE 11480]|uniref:Vitamin K epoxide reductase family protein n=1 Tax=Romeriopsis navalis LEGE 11480 TaxID=2777977 RepID=A0A928VN42_9CYAN|nr:vitamin K epoxide reductase family protein [Romeriopsis navalis]MBE9029545.1 vitamin K epoxide reductase family protein [Romeriopsis navalis LEGE 11480]
MVRAKSTPWIQTWSRPLMAIIAGLGVIDTSYITYEKLTNQSSGICQAGCSTVLNSPYAEIFGQPLALFGLAAYLVIFGLAIAPLISGGTTIEGSNRPTAIASGTQLPLFLTAAAMTLFSGYLMYLLSSEIHAVCYFCIASAIFSTSLLILSIVGFAWESLGQLIFPGLITSMVTIVAVLGLYAPAQAFDPNMTLIKDRSGNVFFGVGTPSGTAETQLANHLKSTGATMYGAYWCPHCCEQKQLFGQSAMKDLNYVECAADGPNQQSDVCRQVVPEVEKLTGEKFGFPTWKINGQYYPGRKPLTELAQLSGYKGPQDFQNPFQSCQMP